MHDVREMTNLNPSMNNPANATTLAASGGWIARAAILVIVLITFWPVGQADFGGWDDRMNVAENARLLPPTAQSLRYYWTRSEADLYIPITHTVWWLLAHAAYIPPGYASPAALDPAVFHLANLVIHAISSLVVFEILRRCIGRTFAAAAGAVLFAVHPVQVESVAWVAGLKDVLAGMFALLGLWQFVAATDSRTSARRRTHWSVATLAFVLGILSKPAVVVLPAIAGLIDWLILHRPIRAVAGRIAPWVVLALPCVIWTRLLQPAGSIGEAIEWWYRPLIAADAIAFYVWKLLWPVSLGVDYGRTPQLAIERGWIYWTWMLPALVSAIVWWARGRFPAALASWLILVVALLPVLGLVPFDFQAYSTVADHYLYLAMLGPAMLLAASVCAVPRRAVKLAAIALLSVLAALSRLQLRHWTNGVTIFSHALRVNPTSWVAHQMLSFESTRRGLHDEALRHARAAAALKPQAVIAHFTLAAALANAGLDSDAIVEYRRLIERDPGHITGRLHLAELLERSGDPESAAGQYHQVLEIDPENLPAQRGLARLTGGPTTRSSR